MLTIHDPSKMKERQNVKPLTMEEEVNVVEMMNYLSTEFVLPLHDSGINLLQRFIHRYENLLHMEACQCKVTLDYIYCDCCNHEMVVDNDMILNANPIKKRYNCENCGSIKNI